jgi:hypothetical protein
MDQQKLRSLVFDRTGIKIDVTDPVFALVALNEAVLEDAVGRHLALMHDATKQLGLQTRNLQNAADQYQRLLGQTTPQQGTASGDDDWESDSVAHPQGPVQADPADPDQPATEAHARLPAPAAAAPGQHWRTLASTACVALLSASAALFGQWLLTTPAKAPPTTQVPAPAPAAISAEKLNRALQKLDPKTKIQLQAELDKP